MKTKYPWLKITTTVEEYINPSYYNRILKDYIFNNKSDLEHFLNWLKTTNTKGKNVLELGCGSGRVTDVFLSNNKLCNRLELLDLSTQMLAYCKEKYKDIERIKYIKSDSIEYLRNTKEKYDLVYSLWSFSHSVHQILHEKGLTDGKKYVQEVIYKFIKENMNKNSNFFLIHFDSLSDEQKILIQQWKKVYKTFEQNDIQSPSLLIIEEILKKLQNENIIKLYKKHYIGKEITYMNEEEALEVFINFHMESYFNESNLLEEVIEELKEYFKKYTKPDGTISIKPGCFIYEVEKK